MKWVILGVVILIGIGVYAFASSQASVPSTLNTTISSENAPDDTALNVPGFPDGTSPVASTPSMITLSLEASRFTYTPSVLHVKSGDNVTIQVTNIDTTHGIRIPALNVQGTHTVNFIAPAPGTYDFSCPTMCGSGHREMQGTLIVE